MPPIASPATRWVLASALALAASSAGAGAQEAGFTGMAAEVESLTRSLGYQSVEALSGELDSGDTATHTLRLEANRAYRFAAICDADCGDIDMELTDANGNRVSQDKTEDAAPVTGVRPAGPANSRSR